MSARTLSVSDDWIQGFFGNTDRAEEDSHSLLEAPPPSPCPDPGLERALAEAMKNDSDASPPRLNRPPSISTASATVQPVAYLSGPRRTLVSHVHPAARYQPAAPPQITVAQRQFYSRAQQSLYNGQNAAAGKGGGSNRRDDLTALAKAAGKKTTTTKSDGSRFITTKSKRVLKVPASKNKKKNKSKGTSKKRGRKSLSRSWPSGGDGFSSSMYHRDDYYDRQAERAEMERGDRK